MVEQFKHARVVSPWFMPLIAGSNDDLHGLTDVGGDPSVSSEDVFIVGQKNKCGTERDIPEVTVPLTQLERGELQSYLTLANLDAKPAGGITLDDYSAARVDVVYYVREEERGTIEGSIWFPKTSLSSLSLSIDADERITREMELTGENRNILTGADNKFLIHKTDTAPSGTSGNYVIDVSDPAPSVDPHNSGRFILRIDRIRAGVLTTLTKTTDYTFDSGANDITILATESGDTFQIFYSSSSFGSAGDPTSVDADSQCFLKAENVKVEINDGTNTVELDNITSLSLDASLDRLDEATVGSTDKIREISETPVTLSLTSRVKSDFNIEKAFMNTLTQDNLISDVQDFKENIKVTIKIYNNSDKDTFLIGYQLSDLSFQDSSLSITANEFGSIDVTAGTTDVTTTDAEGDL